MMSIQGLLQATAVVTVFFSIVTGLDIPHRNIELFSHFRLQYLVVSVLLVFVFGVLRNPTYAGVLLITAIFNASFVLPWYIGDAPSSSGPPLKLVLANVRASSTEYQRLVDFVAAEDPDMVFLQETNSEWVTGTKVLLENYPYAFTESRQGNFGIAMYSKRPLDSVRHVDSPPLNYPTIVATATLNGEPVTFVSTHPMIPLGRRFYAARNEHLKSIVEIVNQTAGKVVLLGDFNASNWDVKFRDLEKSTGLRSTQRGFGLSPSWPTFLPFAMIPIDHVLISEGIGVIETRAGKRIGSDHLPLIVTITL